MLVMPSLQNIKDWMGQRMLVLFFRQGLIYTETHANRCRQVLYIYNISTFFHKRHLWHVGRQLAVVLLYILHQKSVFEAIWQELTRYLRPKAQLQMHITQLLLSTPTDVYVAVTSSRIDQSSWNMHQIKAEWLMFHIMLTWLNSNPWYWCTRYITT